MLEKPALTKAVIGVLWEPKRDKFLAIRRAPGRTFAGNWTPISGKVETSECLEVAMLREFFEETGLRVQVVRGFGYHEVRKPFPFELHWFEVQCLPESNLNDLRLDPEEADQYQWLTISELEQRNHFPEHPEWLRLSQVRSS